MCKICLQASKRSEANRFWSQNDENNSISLTIDQPVLSII